MREKGYLSCVKNSNFSERGGEDKLSKRRRDGGSRRRDGA